MNASHVLEVVLFKSIESATEAQMRAAVIATRAFVEKQPGYVRRSTAFDGHQWIDCVEWQSLEHAKSAAAAFEREPEAAQLMSLVDMGAEMKMLHLQLLP
jgi:hypothetical protein